MSDEFLFNEFSKQGRVSGKRQGPGELHSMPIVPQEDQELPAEMLSIIEEGKQRIRSMIRNGKSCEDVVKLTNLPLDYVQTIQREMGNGRRQKFHSEDSKEKPVS